MRPQRLEEVALVSHLTVFTDKTFYLPDVLIVAIAGVHQRK